MTDTDELPAPPLEVTVKLNGEDQTFKMTYGMEMDLRRLLPDPSAAMSLVLMDQFTQDYAVRRVLTPSKKMLTDTTELIPEESIDISSDDVEKILCWVLGHLLYFFAKRTAGVAQLGKQFRQAMPSLPSSDGSANSPSETPSAGPSESSKET